MTPEAVITREEFDLMKHRFDEQVETLKDKCEKNESPFNDGEMGESPFTSDVLETPIPPKFKMPAMKPYDGSKDPKDYVEVFESLMDFQAASDAIKCRAFQIALTGALGSGIEGCRKIATHLATIRQKEGETLREYVTRFQEEQLKVTHCSDDSAMCYFLTTLADETLTVKLGEEAPSTFAEVLQKAKKVIDGRSDSDSSRRGPYEGYTPTTIPISEILTNIEENGLEKLLKRPDKLRGDPEKRNKDRYCRFHRDHGYDTSNCWELKRQIEDLIQDGYSKKYVGKPGSSSIGKKEERKRSRTPPRRDDRPAVINTIFGGPSGGQSGNKRKELAREACWEACAIQ
ncbi:uncharacterized protein LOC111025585 [Momordica charantia]|uniref:Uncharacterized protein LOC111025585 n=1 Tax=Momordica charantia TaxID=3673 RepID=A0A6J1DXW4_MOMCH|nr:uncharacterized protein LOC111025585 [Momordica charantia]